MELTNEGIMKYIADHTEKDIEANKSLNGVNFSEFDYYFLQTCAGRRFARLFWKLLLRK